MSQYASSVAEQLEKTGTNTETGLSQSQYEKALEMYGENKLIDKEHKNFFQKFLDQMKDLMVIILLVAAAVSFVITLVEQRGNPDASFYDFLDSFIILAIVVINGVLGVQQESKAEKSLDALQSMAAPIAKVMRDGVVQQLPSLQVVPGDIVLLDAGDFIPADGRLIESASLKCEEAALTGESVPVDKHSDAIVEEGAPLGDRLNMVYSGCAVTYGRAKVLVTETGMNTEMGKIAGLLSEAEPDLTPLQVRLNQLGKYIAVIVLGICGVIFALGIIQSNTSEPMLSRVLEAFMTSVSLAVAAIPEGLTAVVTVVLAIGVQRMVKHNAIIRRLPAVETLGNTSVICSDKTGTLTQNLMTVQKVWAVGGGLVDINGEASEDIKHVLRLGALCNDGKIVVDENGENQHIGDPTETAIVAAALNFGMVKEEMEKDYVRIAELPFDSDRKLMTTIHRIGDKIVSITKGGVDVILPLCPSLNKQRIEEVERANLKMAQNALRVLAVAVRELPQAPNVVTTEELEKELTFAGLIGMIDPPREESKAAVRDCYKAGIRTIMITGDHVITASAIAKNLGILGEYDKAVTGKELQAMSDEELAENIEQIRVYARVSPEDKIRIVKAWQKKGEVVAMTGDGVNDAPALKAADIGCAMGITGTDVSKDAADMVLTDDNFSTIVTAIKSGRGIYDNIIKTIQFLLGSNFGEVIAVFIAMLFGWGRPLLPIHLLTVNIVTDALPALALGVEPIEDNVMDRLPIPRDQGIFANGLGIIVGLSGLMIGTITLIGFYIGSLQSNEAGMTMAFLVLAISQLVQAWNCRSHKSIFKTSLTSNPTMIKAFFISLGVVLAICLIKPLEKMFKMVDLTGNQWVWVVALSLSTIVFMEIGKLVSRLIKKRKMA